MSLHETITESTYRQAGLAFAGLARQVVRMHRSGAATSDRASLIAWLRREVDELEAEVEGTDEAAEEDAYALALALHLILLDTRSRPARAIQAVADKLHRRLDEVERGATWAEAKERVG